jgi:hypothetical protein
MWIETKDISTLYLSPESYEVNFKAGLLAYPVPAAFPIRFIAEKWRGCRNTFMDSQLRVQLPNFCRSAADHGIPFSLLSAQD